MKRCGRCREDKPYNEFYNETKGKYGLRGYCKKCDYIAGTQWSKRNKKRRREIRKKSYTKLRAIESIRRRSRRYYKLFGITFDEKMALRTLQENKCALCLDEFETDRDCKVDHDHKTGKMRKLLCNDCNVGLGYFKDDIELLTKAIAYIREHTF